jgi:hypothetical protein
MLVKIGSLLGIKYVWRVKQLEARQFGKGISKQSKPEQSSNEFGNSS